MSRLFPDDGCVDIQDLYQWRNEIADIIQEYVDNPTAYEGYVFAVYPSLKVAIEKSNNIDDTEIETFNLADLVCVNEQGKIEVDYDKVDELSDKFMFVAR